MEHDTNNIPELQSPFEQLREVDADGKEWWNSRKLARVMGYGKYWNFERVIAKAQAWTTKKGYQQYFSATMTPDVAVRSMESSVLMYRGGHGKVQVQVIFDTNTFWLSQQRMAELFGVTQQNISYHLSQIEESGELHLSDTIRKIRIPSDKWSGEVMM